MFLSYIKATASLLKRDLSFSLVNLLGLACGMACCILLGLHLQHELSYDRHFAGHENIYRVVSEASAAGSTSLQAPVYFQVAEQLKQDFPEVLEAVRFEPLRGMQFSVEDTSFNWDDVYAADAAVFKMFSHHILYGDAATALQEPGSIAISESLARAYFGSGNPLGQVLANKGADYKVTLVFADLPSNTHLKYDALLARVPVDIDDPVFQIDYRKGSPLYEARDYTYVRMPENYDPAAFAGISAEYSTRYLQRFGSTFNASVRYFLEPLAEIHFHSGTLRDLPRGSVYFLYSFSGIALLVLLIACANYVNLSTSRFARRDREIRVRHVMGASRFSLFLRFMLEAQVYAFLALPLAVLFAAVLLELSVLGSVIGNLRPLQSLLQPEPLLLLLGMTFLAGLLAGVYPALQHVRACFGQLSQSVLVRSKSLVVRRGLLFLQLVISVGVIATTLLMYRQIRFVQETPRGFNEKNMLVLEVRQPANIDKLPALLNVLNAESSIVAATYSEELPGLEFDFRPHSLETEEGSFRRKNVTRQRVHDSYMKVMEIEVMAGRDFSAADFAVVDHEDSPDRIVMVNETLARQMQWEQATGKVIGSYRVIGVVRDFRFQGIEQQVEPLVIYMDKPRWANKTPAEIVEEVRYLMVRFPEGGYASARAKVQEHWQEFYPDQLFATRLLEDHLASLSSADNKQLSLVAIFGSLCIFIATLGLYCLSAFTTEQRSKEITIRKVMGASVSQITLLFLKGLMQLVVLAGIVASMLSWWVVSEWLKSFHMQQGISLLMLFIATASMAVLAVGTVALQAAKVASRKPGLMLRYE